MLLSFLYTLCLGLSWRTPFVPSALGSCEEWGQGEGRSGEAERKGEMQKVC